MQCIAGVSFSAIFLSRSLFTVPCCTSRVSWKAQLRVFLPPRVWNPMMEQLFHAQIGGIFEPFVDETELARIAISCHFALDLLCDREGAHASA